MDQKIHSVLFLNMAAMIKKVHMYHEFFFLTAINKQQRSFAEKKKNYEGSNFLVPCHDMGMKKGCFSSFPLLAVGEGETASHESSVGFLFHFYQYN